MNIKNLKEASDRIKEAIKNKEEIVLYGDSDLDGVVSVIVMKDTIKSLGGKISKIYFPDYSKEKYGINDTALESLKEFAPALLISVDLGISNFEEIDIANEMGFEVIVVDHHEVLEKLPNASIIVDPKQPEDNYPFKNFAAAGVVLKLAEVLFGKFPSSIENDFYSIVALATVADMMPREDDNINIIKKGFDSFYDSWRPGLRALFEMPPFNESYGVEEMIFKIIGLLNVREIENTYPASFNLMTSNSSEESKIMIKRLLKKQQERKRRIEGIIKDIESKILNKPTEEIIFEGDSSWESTEISAVASRLSAKYKKPVFIFVKGEVESKGTMRSPRLVNGLEAIKSCEGLLLTYGGHPQAAGYRLKNENIEEFKKCLINNFLKQ